MRLYGIDKINKSVIIGCFIFLKYNDAESIKNFSRINNPPQTLNIGFQKFLYLEY